MAAYRELAGDDAAEVARHRFDVREQRAQRRHLRLDILRQCRDRGVLDIAQQVLDANLLGLEGADFGGEVLEGPLHGGGLGVGLLHRDVRLRRQLVLLHIDVDDHKHRVLGRALAPIAEQVVDLDVDRLDLGAGAVPADDLLLRRDLLEHPRHLLEIVVVQVPHPLALVVLIERHCTRNFRDSDQL